MVNRLLFFFDPFAWYDRENAASASTALATSHVQTDTFDSSPLKPSKIPQKQNPIAELTFLSFKNVVKNFASTLAISAVFLPFQPAPSPLRPPNSKFWPATAFCLLCGIWFLGIGISSLAFFPLFSMNYLVTNLVTYLLTNLIISAENSRFITLDGPFVIHHS